MALSAALAVLEAISPGSGRSVKDNVAKVISARMETDPEPHLMDALNIIAEWDSVEVVSTTTVEMDGMIPPAQRSESAPQHLIDSKDWGPATVEGMACAHLAIDLVILLLFKMDQLNPRSSIVPDVLNEATTTTSKRNMENPSPMYENMLEILRVAQGRGAEQWQRMKAEGKI